MTPESAPQDEATDKLVDRLRNDVVPEATAGGAARAYVSGQTAAFKDIADQIIERMPLFLLYIIGVTLILLAMAFRSIVISATAAITTILSAFVGFGVLGLVVQEGHLLGLTGLDQTGPIETFVPPIAFAILFGLSMDYMVFLMSRIREEHVHGLVTRDAVEHGISAIGRVIVAAALIMGTVFAAFILSADRIPKEFGLLLAVAILTDALIVRMTLVPALLTHAGREVVVHPAVARPGASERDDRAAAGRQAGRRRDFAGALAGLVLANQGPEHDRDDDDQDEPGPAHRHEGLALARAGARLRGVGIEGRGGLPRQVVFALEHLRVVLDLSLMLVGHRERPYLSRSIRPT